MKSNLDMKWPACITDRREQTQTLLLTVTVRDQQFIDSHKYLSLIF